MEYAQLVVYAHDFIVACLVLAALWRSAHQHFERAFGRLRSWYHVVYPRWSEPQSGFELAGVILRYSWLGALIEILVGFGITVAVAVIYFAGLWLLRWFRKRDEAENLASEAARVAQQPETVREGSAFSTMRRAPFIMGVYADAGNQRMLVGTAWRCDDFVITAGHVVFDEGVVGKLWLEHEGRYFKADDWVAVEADIAVLRYDPQWCVPSAQVGPLHGKCHSMVCSAASQDNVSLGILSHSPEVAYGFVEYSGSTRAGFSGSPYTNGSRVLGMHIGGGVVNYGYAATYIKSMFRRVRGKENSEMFALMEALRRAKRRDIAWEYDLDEARFRVGGHYFILDREEADELLELDEFEDIFYEDDFSDDGIRTRRGKVRRKNWDAQSNHSTLGSWGEDLGEWNQLEGVKLPPPEQFGEVVIPQEPGFVTSPQSDLRLGALEKDLGSLTTSMRSIHDTLLSFRQECTGLQARVGTLQEVCTFMQERENNRDANIARLVEKSLSEQLARLQPSIGSDSKGASCPVKPDSMPILNTSSQLLTPNQPSVSANSPSGGGLVLRWDTMDSDLRMLREWKSSRDSSQPDYAASRRAFLDSLGLSLDRQKALIARLKNNSVAMRKKAKRRTQ